MNDASAGDDKPWRAIILNGWAASRNWFIHQENKGLKLTLVALVGCMLTMYWYLNAQFREFQQLSQVLRLTTEYYGLRVIATRGVVGKVDCG